MIKNFLLVALGGALGSVLRYLFSLLIKHNYLPLSTFAVNIIGSFFIGLVMGYASNHHEGFGEWRLFLATGICGGFTTFSSFSWENINLMEHGRYAVASLYIGGTLLLGFTATVFGYWITRFL